MYFLGPSMMKMDDRFSAFPRHSSDDVNWSDGGQTDEIAQGRDYERYLNRL